MLGQEVYGKSLYLLNFAMNLKLLKNKVYINNNKKYICSQGFQIYSHPSLHQNIVSTGKHHREVMFSFAYSDCPTSPHSPPHHSLIQELSISIYNSQDMEVT